MAQREAEELRRELDGVTSRHGRCFPPELAERAGRWIAARRAEGATVSEIGEELGLGDNTVRSWCKRASSPTTRALVPVQVVPDAPARTVSIVSPAGFRIDGLSLGDAVALLKALG